MSLTQLDMFRDGGTIKAKMADGTSYRIDGRINSPTRGKLFVTPPDQEERPVVGELAGFMIGALRDAYKAYAGQGIYPCRVSCEEFFKSRPYPILENQPGAEPPLASTSRSARPASTPPLKP